MKRLLPIVLGALMVPLSNARADEPITQRDSWEGAFAHFMTGASLAEDTDSDNKVDSSAQPASFDISSSDIATTATLDTAVLYWGGGQSQSGTACGSGSSEDDTVTLDIPDGSSLSVTADDCYCSDGGASSYDYYLCKADISSDVSSAGGTMIGTWTVDDYSGRWSDGATDSASAALLLVYTDTTLDPRRVVLYDGLQVMSSTTETLSLSGFDVDATPGGSLTWYTMEGDTGGSGTEQVDVTGSPGGGTLTLSDAINSSSNPMNRTINTTSPVQTGVIGVDIDQFDITSALTAYDTSIDVDYSAGTDKWWLAVNVVGVDQYDPLFGESSEKTWTLYSDADGDGTASVGDTVRYTITLCNTGNEDGTVDLSDPIPSEAASWSLVDDGGGTDASTAGTLIVNDISVAAGACEDVVFDVVLDDVADESTMSNTATYGEPDEGGEGGTLTASDVTIRRDGDSDGSYDNDDCDPADATVYPGASESCNGVDDDCDGTVDEGVTTTFYADSDGDGYGDASSTTDDCSAPTGYVSDDTDCDDTDGGVYPGADEYCNGVDDDCDGSVDEGAVDTTTYYADGDGDGYGDPSLTADDCSAPTGYVSNDNDCDDSDASVNPAATEICNSVDDDCDGSIDEGVTTTYYADSDGDGYGDASSTTDDCSAPTGYVADDSDCDDADASVHPTADEYCNGVDDDCDGTVDESAVDATTYYADADGDGYGDASSTTADCSAPTGYVSDDSDCDDTDGGVYPGADEYCNGVDDDCDGTVDESAVDATTYYADADGDGYGDASSTAADCSTPTGYVADDSDCDDTDGSVNPGATEVCNSVDDDCDGSVDEGVTTTYYADSDGDGYGDASSTTEDCSTPTGYVSDDSDCDDSDSSVNPAATEVCDGVDNDCDGRTDEGVKTKYYADSDGDGYGDASSFTRDCSAPTGYVSDDTDCDDADAAVYPGADEYCNSVDDDCDGDIDEEAVDASTWYADADGDSYGDASDSADDCSAPSGYVADDTDCDDTDSAVYPGADEYCNGVDDDCDGTVDEDDALDAGTWYADADSDGYGDASSTDDACSAPSGYVADDSDCDDTDASVNPGATEVCNGVDDDCDGSIDEGVTTTYYADADSDGYGDASSTTDDCSAPTGYVADDTDCDDADGAVYPGADEYCNSVDDDCDGTVDEDAVDATTYYADADGDSYGDASSTYDDCSAPSGYVSDDSDCDDTDSAVYPGADEYCNGVDDDCDGTVDEDDAVDASTWYADNDSDGYGNAKSSDTACYEPSGYVADDSDCDDTDNSVNPAASEVAYDGVDNDCDGSDLCDVDGDGEDYDGAECYGTDCNDNDAAVYSGATETADGVDEDCDGTVDEETEYYDDDGDGYTEAGGDCDDDDSDVNPAGTEDCDGVDDDCDGTVDEEHRVLRRRRRRLDRGRRATATTATPM